MSTNTDLIELLRSTRENIASDPITARDRIDMRNMVELDERAAAEIETLRSKLDEREKQFAAARDDARIKRVCDRLESSDPEFDDCTDAVHLLVALQMQLQAAADWQQRALDERLRRVDAEGRLDETSGRLTALQINHAAMVKRLRTDLADAEKRCAEARDLGQKHEDRLNSALERMDRAREILRHESANWSMLDTADLREGVVEIGVSNSRAHLAARGFECGHNIEGPLLADMPTICPVCFASQFDGRKTTWRIVE
jgi:hypothetical protein